VVRTAPVRQRRPSRQPAENHRLASEPSSRGGDIVDDVVERFETRAETEQFIAEVACEPNPEDAVLANALRVVAVEFEHKTTASVVKTEMFLAKTWREGVMNGVDHIGLTVSRLEQSIPFYRLLLGREPVFEQVVSDPHVAEIVGYEAIELGIALFEIPGSSTILELLEYRAPAGTRFDMETSNPGNVHVCLIVEDLDAEFARLSAAGVAFRSAGPVYAPRGLGRARRRLICGIRTG
jgi:catechol 2,3-dioxygenase-like lactoylglutathione lyase family enzyme